MKPISNPVPRRAVLTLALGVVAGAGPLRTDAADARSATADPTRMRASQLIGMPVRSPDGASLGRIDDLVIDLHAEAVQFAVLSFGGFLGLGDRLFPYPLNALRRNGDALLLDADRDQLRRAPGFDPRHWPDWTDPRVDSELRNYFGPRMPARQGTASRARRASELLDAEVRDRTGAEAGEIEDLVLDLDTGRVRAVVVEFEQGRLASGRLLVLPPRALTIPAARDADPVLAVAPEVLKGYAGFDEGRWPDDIGDPPWQQRLRRQGDAAPAASPEAGR